MTGTDEELLGNVFINFKTTDSLIDFRYLASKELVSSLVW